MSTKEGTGSTAQREYMDGNPSPHSEGKDGDDALDSSSSSERVWVDEIDVSTFLSSEVS